MPRRTLYLLRHYVVLKYVKFKCSRLSWVFQHVVKALVEGVLGYPRFRIQQGKRAPNLPRY